MPRKNSAPSVPVIEKSKVKEAFLDCKTLCEDSVSRAVADMVAKEHITREQGEKISAVLQPVLADSIFRTMSNRGF